MENTYTYTARSIEDSEKVVTFTLRDDRMSVDIGAPVEQIARTVAEVTEDIEEKHEPEKRAKVWLKPLAVALIERGTVPLRIIDVDARVHEDHLTLRSWLRLDGLRLVPITLMKGRIDNPAAAAAFVVEVNARKEELATGLPSLNFLNYWGTWLGAVLSMVALFIFWQRHTSASESAA